MTGARLGGHSLLEPLLHWRFVLGCLSAFALALWSLGVLQDVWLAGFGGDRIWLLDADTETGALTWMSVLGLFSASVLLFVNGQDALRSGQARVLPWFLLSLAFAVLSFDEFYSLHEKLSSLIESTTGGGSGLLYFAWALPAGALSVLGLVLLLPFLNSLERRTGLLMVTSALLFLCGAVGMEMIGGSIMERQGYNAFAYRLATNLEEGLELAGTLLFLHVLFEHRDKTAS